MEDHTAGLATETSPETVEQRNVSIFENAFNDAMAKQPQAPEPSEAPTEPKAQVQPPAKADPVPEPEFPEELLTGEKPAPKEPEKDDLDDIQPSTKMGEAQKGNFAKLKDLTRAARAEAQQFKAELEKLKTAPKETGADPEEIKTYRQKIAEMEALVERTNFESSPKYRALVDAGRQAITDAKAYLEGTEIDPSVIDYAAIAKGKARTALLRDAGIDAETIALIAPSLAEADRKERERGQALENAKGMQSEWQQQEKARQESQKAYKQAEEDGIFDTVMTKVAKVFEPFQKFEGAEKWNTQREALMQRAKDAYNGDKLSLEEFAEVVAYGVGAKVIHNLYHTVRAENKTLKERLSKVSAAQPSNGSTNGRTTEPVRNGPMSEEQLFAERAASFDRAMGR